MMYENVVSCVCGISKTSWCVRCSDWCTLLFSTQVQICHVFVSFLRIWLRIFSRINAFLFVTDAYNAKQVEFHCWLCVCVWHFKDLHTHKSKCNVIFLFKRRMMAFLLENVTVFSKTSLMRVANGISLLVIMHTHARAAWALAFAILLISVTRELINSLC